MVDAELRYQLDENMAEQRRARSMTRNWKPLFPAYALFNQLSVDAVVLKILLIKLSAPTIRNGNKISKLDTRERKSWS